MRFFKKFEKVVTDLYSYRYFVFYLASVFWLPFTQVMAEGGGTKATPFMAALSTYSGEAIIIASFFQ